MERAATDIYTFARLREDGFTYVDKTDALYAMASGEVGAQFFIARPRRFGKSLAVSTLKSLFEGKRELFEGLAIEPKWNWSVKWPVLHLDMGSMQARNVAEFRELLVDHLIDRARELGVEGLSGSSPAILFKRLIDALAAKSLDGRMVLLVDEYDKPLLGHLMKPDVTEFRDELKAFYSVIKTLECRQRFAFITGVSKFSKVSIFSDLNNLKDYTFNPVVATLFGYTHEEVKKYFPESIAALGEKLGKTPDGAFADIVKWYDGYRFEENAEPVINPVSLGMTFDEKKLGNWWSLTAMPTFLLDFFKEHPMDVSDLSVTDADLAAYEPEHLKPVTMLFQTGYLTIRGFEQVGGLRRYFLKFPNLEVESSFLTDLSALYIGSDNSGSANIAAEVVKSLYARDPERFVEMFRRFFAAIPYDLTDRQNEQSWQAIMYAVLRLVGVNVGGEVKTGKGRIDLTVETATDAYIIEVKRDSTARKAIEQIQDKSYTDRFRLSGKPITLIGIAFSTKKRNVSSVKIVRDISQLDCKKSSVSTVHCG